MEGLKLPKGTLRTVAVMYWSVVLPGLAVWWPEGAPEVVMKSVMLAGLALNAMGLGRAAVGALQGKGGNGTGVVPILALGAFLALSGVTGCSKKQQQVNWGEVPGYVQEVEVIEAPEKPVEASSTPRAIETPPEPVVAQRGTQELSKTVYFPFDSWELSEAARWVLDMEVPAGGTMLLTGGACPIGEDPYNYQLGLKRAYAVKDYLVMHRGVSPDCISVQSVGEEDLVSDDQAHYGLNRRCEIQVERK